MGGLKALNATDTDVTPINVIHWNIVVIYSKYINVHLLGINAENIEIKIDLNDRSNTINTATIKYSSLLQTAKDLWIIFLFS